MNAKKLTNGSSNDIQPIKTKVSNFFSEVWSFMKRNWYLLFIYGFIFILLWFISPSFVANYCQIQLDGGIKNTYCVDYKKLFLWSMIITIMVFTVYALYKILNFNNNLSKLIERKISQ
jgi:hypothetical protein